MYLVIPSALIMLLIFFFGKLFIFFYTLFDLSSFSNAIPMSWKCVKPADQLA